MYSKNLLTSQVDFMVVITQMNITKRGQDRRKSQQSPVNRVQIPRCIREQRKTQHTTQLEHFVREHNTQHSENVNKQ